ncbi:MAG: cyclic nucleotide-binding domain-containing protein [Brevefilum sp.]|nr:cyclic nucleotide-binding domain-containing protein [Brevefilum sp.]
MEIRHETVIEVLSQAPLFAQLRPFELKRFASLFNPVVYQDGDLVFDLGDHAESMYVLYEGQVELSIDESEAALPFARLGSGDFFGEEALLYDDPRYYSAAAVGMTVLLRLDIENFLIILGHLPQIEKLLEVSIDSRRLSTAVPLPWLHEDEYVHVMTRRHPAILWSKIALPILAGVGVVLLSILMQWFWLPEQAYGWIGFAIGLPAAVIWFTWSYIDWRNDYFIVTNKRVVWIEKVAFIYESRQEAPLRTIMSVGIHRSRIGTALGFGDVVVTTYVGTIRLREIPNTDMTAELIESYWHRSDSMNRREEAQMMGRKLEQKLDLPFKDEGDFSYDDELPVLDETPSDTKEPGFLAWLFSDFIRLRFEQDGAITYRKHWFVLIRYLWLPVLLMLSAIVAAVLRLGGMLAFIPVTSAMVFILLAMFAIFLWMLYVYVDWRNDIFMVTLDQIVDLDRKPLGKVRRRSAPLENVLSIEYERLGLWGYLFNFGTVYIIVGTMRLSFDHVYNPSEVQEDIFYRMGERLEKVRQFEIDAERERVSEWIASYHRKTAGLHQTRPHRSRRDD